MGGRVGGGGAVECFSYLFMYLHIRCNLLTSKLHQTHRRLLIPSEMLLATDVAWGLTWKRLSHPTSNLYPGNCNSGRWATATCLSRWNRWNRQNRSWSYIYIYIFIPVPQLHYDTLDDFFPIWTSLPDAELDPRPQKQNFGALLVASVMPRYMAFAQWN